MLYFEGVQFHSYESSDCPHPPLQAALPPLYGSRTITHLEENSGMVKIPYLCKKAKGKPVWLRSHHM
jgi:hypothetical protein